MKFYISATGGFKRVIVSNSSAAGKGSLPTVAPARRFTGRALLSVALLLGIALPLLFVRFAFLVLESAAICSSPIECIGWRFLGGNDGNHLLREELTGALLEAREKSTSSVHGMEGSVSVGSFEELVKEMTAHRHDIKAFAFKTKAMLSRMEEKIHKARERESMYWHLASHGVPKSMHCLSLKLAEEYAVNAVARSLLPLPLFVDHLSDPSLHHVVLLTDNVLAASVVVSSTIKTCTNPHKFVFHIVTDKKTYSPMHAWFSINPLEAGVVEVKGLHRYDWSEEVNVGVKDIIHINHLTWQHYYNNFKQQGLDDPDIQTLDAITPTNLSLLNFLRIYIPELFPDLNKVVFLEDDVVVQHDLSPLWGVDLQGKVVGAVVNSWCGDECCPGRRYKDYLNFSHQTISSNFAPDRCAWLYGVNLFDLEAWRRNDITAIYQQWLKQSLKMDLSLWKPGILPPALLAFEGHVHPLDSVWLLSGLGNRFFPQVNEQVVINTAAVIHFDGPAKPWLEIGSTELRRLWYRHVNVSNQLVKKCRIMR